MRGVFKNLRRTFGIGSLLTSLVFTGAWVKSYVDHSTIFGSKQNQANLLSVPGTIGVSGYSNRVEWPGHLPQINWYVSGFYAVANFVIAPEQTVNRSSTCMSQPIAPFVVNQPPQSIMNSVSQDNLSVMSAIYTEEADSSEINLIPASASKSSFVPVSEARPRVGISFEYDVSEPDANLDSSDEHDNMVESKFQYCGFHYLHGVMEDGSWECAVQFPHWSVVLPLGLLSAVILIGPGRKNFNNGTGNVASWATSPSGIDGTYGLAGFFGGWRRKSGAVMLLISLALTGGWVRASIVTDVLNFEFKQGKQLLLASGKEGVVCQYNRIPCSVGSGTRYRMITGPQHESTTFIPLDSDLELADLDVNIPDTGAGQLPNGATMRSDVKIFPGEMPNMFGPQGDLLVSLQEPDLLSSMTQDSGVLPQPAEDRLPRLGMHFIDISNGTEAGMTEWAGTALHWGRFYISHGPMETHFVIPYGFVVLPLTLFSAMLLFTRNKRNIKHTVVSVG